MHQTRQEISRKLPIPRKGTKYVARASSDLDNSVPVVIAVRDMLKLAQTAREVKIMIKQKLIKINGKQIKNGRTSIKLLNILEVGDKVYRLSLLPTKKFYLEETKERDFRVCRVVNKKVLKGKRIQLNLHDGSNVLTKDNVNIGDTIYIDLKGIIKKQIPISEGKKVLIIKGKNLGKLGVIESLKDGKALVNINKHGAAAEIDSNKFIVL